MKSDINCKVMQKHFLLSHFLYRRYLNNLAISTLFAASTFRKMEQYSEEDWCSVDDGSIFLVAS